MMKIYSGKKCDENTVISTNSADQLVIILKTFPGPYFDAAQATITWLAIDEIGETNITADRTPLPKGSISESFIGIRALLIKNTKKYVANRYAVIFFF